MVFRFVRLYILKVRIASDELEFLLQGAIFILILRDNVRKKVERIEFYRRGEIYYRLRNFIGGTKHAVAATTSINKKVKKRREKISATTRQPRHLQIDCISDRNFRDGENAKLLSALSRI